MKRKISVLFSKEASKEIKALKKTVENEKKKKIKNSSHQQLLKSIKNKIEQVKQDAQYGAHVSKKLINKANLPVTNLWVVDLSNSWRMLYTLRGDKVEVICFVLRIFDHDKYNKLFGYKKK